MADVLHLMSPADISLHMGDESPSQEIKLAKEPLCFTAHNGCTYQKVNGKERCDFKLAKGDHVKINPFQVVSIPNASGEPDIDKSVEEMRHASDQACDEEDILRYKKRFMFSIHNSDTDPQKKDMFHISYDGFVHHMEEQTNESSKEHNFQIALHDNRSFRVHSDVV